MTDRRRRNATMDPPPVRVRGPEAMSEPAAQSGEQALPESQSGDSVGRGSIVRPSEGHEASVYQNGRSPLMVDMSDVSAEFVARMTLFVGAMLAPDDSDEENP